MLDDAAAAVSFDAESTMQTTSVRPTPPRVLFAPGLQIRMVRDLELVLVTKVTPGFSTSQIAQLHALLKDIAAGEVGPCKFLVFDLAARGRAPDETPAGYEACLEDLSNLIFEAPVVSIAWVRHGLAGADLELGLACSMMAAETGARLSFDLDLVDSLRTYALLAHKLGFVQAERLMEEGATVDAETAHALMILHSVVPADDGLDGIRRFVAARMRRHNSACGLYRAQRITMLRAA